MHINSTLSSASISLVSLAALLSANPALAQDGATEREAFDAKGGFYISADAGISLPSDGNFAGIQAPVAPSPGMPGAPANVAVEYGSDITAQGAIGYRIPKRFFGLFQTSIELEYNIASANVSRGAFNAGNQSFSGDVDVNSYSVNYRSDIRWSNGQKVIPFLGGGVGIVDVDANIRYFPNNGTATEPTFGVFGSDNALTLQSNAGVRFVLTDKVELQTRVRYQRVRGLDFERRFIANGNNALNAPVSGNYESLNFLAGLLFNF